jgi:hypothetical protein
MNGLPLARVAAENSYADRPRVAEALLSVWAFQFVRFAW